LNAQHLVSDRDLSPDDLEEILQLTARLKADPGAFADVMRRKSLAMIFMKPSTRTRVSFEAGMNQLGGNAIYLTPNDSQIGRDESIPDTARVLSRFCDLIMARVFAHEMVAELAQYATVPVINGLSDLLHPVQMLADLFTIRERFPNERKLTLVYVGDGNNVCHSLMLGVARSGMSMRAVCPDGYTPDPDITQQARDDAEATGAQIEVTSDLAAVVGADVVYTDTFISMGQEADRARRVADLHAYQVNAALMASAKPGAIFMHCLPAHRGEEVTAEVIDGPQSVVFDQAENRLHAQKALMCLLLARRGKVTLPPEHGKAPVA
jgi:ornithine carbamoyltransferase